VLEFEHPEDREFFSKLLCGPGETPEAYADLLYFRSEEEKDAEFARVDDGRRDGQVRLIDYYCAEFGMPASSRTSRQIDLGRAGEPESSETPCGAPRVSR
jgi:hypothetical protein